MRIDDHPPTVSVVIPVFRAEATLERAVASLVAQTFTDWEAIVVADDGGDPRGLLAAVGLDDVRLRHVSSGGVGTGCARARNVGLAAARGRHVTRLDADDLFLPDRLARLVPLAEARGAATDMVSVVDDATGRVVRETRLDDGGAVATAADLALLHCPLAPLVARARAPIWFDDVDIAEDVLYLFALEERVGPLAVLTERLYEYRVRLGSMCHGADGAERAERSYAAIDGRLAAAGFPQISAERSAAARSVFAAKRAFNRRFAEAFAAGRARDFQDFRAAVEADEPRGRGAETTTER